MRMGLVVLMAILSLSASAVAGEDATNTTKSSKKDLLEKIESLTAQLAARDNTIDILEDQLNAGKKNLALKNAIIETRDTEIANLKQIQANQQSLAKFQESQIEQLRRVIRNQREELNKHNGEE